jgi:RNA polymerase sigma-70 factor (ECF subfamily)
VPEATLAQRIVRAKRKIGQAGIPLRIASAGEMPDRLDDVLTVVSLTYNAGYLAPPVDARHDLAADALWLAELIARELPDEPEALGLLALLMLLDARAAARFDAEGRLVPLAEQDRARWDRERIAAADRLLERAAARHRTGRYQLQAALAACHANATSSAQTDWLQILTLYDVLVRLDPSPVVRLNRAIALREVEGAEAALREVDRIADRLGGYHLLHAVRAQLLAALGREREADDANRRALALAAHPAEQGLLRLRIGDPI